MKRGTPRFCYTLLCFGAIFKVRPSPESKKIDNKMIMEITCFLVVQETYPGVFFCDLGVYVLCCFGASGGTFKGN